MGKALVDANVIVALYRPDDFLHHRATTLVSQLKKDHRSLVLTNLVIQEIATVLSMRVGMVLARKFLKDYKDIADEEIFVDENLEKQSWQIFSKQLKKGTSFVDCANLAVMQHYHLDGIATFDEFYPKAMRLFQN